MTQRVPDYDRPMNADALLGALMLTCGLLLGWVRWAGRR